MLNVSFDHFCFLAWIQSPRIFSCTLFCSFVKHCLFVLFCFFLFIKNIILLFYLTKLQLYLRYWILNVESEEEFSRVDRSVRSMHKVTFTILWLFMSLKWCTGCWVFLLDKTIPLCFLLAITTYIFHATWCIKFKNLHDYHNSQICNLLND